MVSYDMMWEWMQIIFARFRLSTLKATGEIYSEDTDIQRDLHSTLNLNSEKHQLKKNRTVKILRTN